MLWCDRDIRTVDPQQRRHAVNPSPGHRQIRLIPFACVICEPKELYAVALFSVHANDRPILEQRSQEASRCRSKPIYIERRNDEGGVKPASAGLVTGQLFRPTGCAPSGSIKASQAAPGTLFLFPGPYCTS